MENQGPLTPDEPGSHPDVRTHAPTLLGADQPGGQGEVRVWAPSLWRRRTQLVALAFTTVILARFFWTSQIAPNVDIPGHLHSHFMSWIIPAECAAALFALLCAWLQIRQPRYITTDTSGFAITACKGSRALRWDEIRSARSVHYAKIALQTEKGPLKLSLQTYSEGLAEDLFALIVNRANLYRSPDDMYMFLPEERVKERFVARQRSAVLERPPMPANRRFTNDTVAKRTFMAAVALLVACGMAGIGVILRSHQTFGRVSLTAHHTLNYKKGFPAHAVIPWAYWGYRTYKYRVGNPDLWYDAMSSHSTMFRMLFELRRPTNGSGLGDEAPYGYATIWLNQRLNTPIATPSLSGYRIGSTTATWAPAEMEGAPSSLYRYDIGFRFAKGQKTKPAHIAVTLSYGSHRRRYDLGNPYFGSGVERCNYYLNSEESALEESGPVIGSLPSPRTWRYIGISADSVRYISGVRFEPAPTTEDFEPADGKYLAAAVAAWLPGRFTGNRLNCDIIYRDGGVRHLVLSPGVQVKGINIRWNMPAKLEKQLPEGPI